MKPLIYIIDTTNEPNILQTNQRGAASYTAQNNMKTLKKLISYSFSAVLWWAFIYVASNLDTILYDLLIK